MHARDGLLAAGLQGVATLAVLTAAQRLAAGIPLPLLVLLAPGLLLAGTAAAGAAAVGMGVPWLPLVRGTVAGSAAAVAAAWSLLPAPGPGALGSYPGAGWDALGQAAVLLVTASTGVFALPLLDPRVRARGPAPRRSRVLAAAAAAALALAGVARILPTGGRFAGLGTLVLGSAASAGLASVGLVLAVAGRSGAGAALGGTALALWAATVLAWLAAGAPWFP